MTYLYLIKSPRRVKIGIGWNLSNRVTQIDRTTRGKQRLILAVVLPFKARQIEAFLHRRYKAYHAPLKAGSGRSEYFRAGLLPEREAGVLRSAHADTDSRAAESVERAVQCAVG